MWEALSVILRQRDPEVASLRRRAVASCIDAACVLSTVAAAIGGTVLWDRRQDGPVGARRLGPMDRWNAWSQSPAWRRSSTARAVALRNVRSPGQTLMGVRRVDARTGGPVTARSALTGVAFNYAWTAITKRVTGPMSDRFKARDQEPRADLDESRRGNPDAPPVEGGFTFTGGQAAGCCGVLLAMVAIQQLPRALTSRRQNLSDWVAGIIVVRD